MRHIIKYKINTTVLPDEYTQLDYIKSSGTQYIDTGYKFNTSTDTLEVQYESVNGTNSYKWCFGSYTSGGISGAFGITTGNGTTHDNLFYNTAKTISSSYFTGKHTFVADNNGVSIDSTNVAAYLNFESDNTLYLFSIKNGGSTNDGQYKIYSYKQTRSGNTLLNLIPAQRISDSEIGMYDTVSQTFFTNAGTGTFEAGTEGSSLIEKKGLVVTNKNIVIPSGYTQLESIIDNGEAYIDTGIIPTTTMSFEIIAKANSTRNRWLLGSSASNHFYVISQLSNNALEIKINNSDWQQSSTGFDMRDTKFTLSSNSTGYTIVSDSGIAHSDTFEEPFTNGSDLPILIGARTPSTASCYIGNLYSFKIYNNNTLYRNYVPAKRTSDNKVGMYETETNTFNYGVGTFDAGNKISNNEIVHAIKTQEAD